MVTTLAAGSLELVRKAACGLAAGSRVEVKLPDGSMVIITSPSAAHRVEPPLEEFESMTQLRTARSNSADHGKAQ